MAEENEELIEEIREKINIQIHDDGNIEVREHEPILIKPKSQKERPSRHVNSLQVDLGLFDKRLQSEWMEGPICLIIIEVKGSKSISTHDVLIYSSKARKHKNLFPWLRYGMVWSSPPEKENGIPRRFFMNNENLDFAYNFEENIDGNFKIFYENILKTQIEISRTLYDIFEKKIKVEYFSSYLKFGKKIIGKEEIVDEDD